VEGRFGLNTKGTRIMRLGRVHSSEVQRNFYSERRKGLIARVVAACFFTGASTTLAQFAAPVTPPTATKWMTRLEAFEFLTDCNNNGLADECDLDCMALGASCNQPGCGGSDDCDWTGGGANGIPDECDIADCSDNPNCDDCNLNSVPDGCDIAKMTSLDADGNGVPDECITNSPICGRSTLGICLPLFWTNEIAWQLDGGYPDNKDSVPDLVVTLAGLMFLNDSVEIDGLRITPSSLLSVTQTGILGDLTIVLPGPLPAVECASTVDGECRVAGSPKEWNARGLIPPPRLAVSGYLEIGDGRRV